MDGAIFSGPALATVAVVEKLGAPRRRRLACAVLWSVFAAGSAAYGCSASASDRAGASDGAGPFGGNFSVGGNGTNPNPGGGAAGGAIIPPPLPPEEEKENQFELPVLSGRWVWSANPDSGRVAVIDTRTREVELAQAGFAPTYLAALKAEGDVESAAIVLNARSHDATLMRLRRGEIDATQLPTHVGPNAWAISPSGRWAIAWSNAALVEKPDRAESFQDVTLIDTAATPPRATRLSVGYRPSRVFVQDDEARAFVVTEAGISIVELTGDEPSVSRDISVSEDLDASSSDVSVVPSGTHAVVRTEGSPVVRVIELDSGRRTDVTLSGPVTDLDLVADGSAALVVVRGRPIATGGGAGGEGGLGGGGTSDGGAIAEAGQGGDGGDGGADAGGGGTGGAGSTPPASDFGPSEVAILPIPAITADATRFDRVEIDELVGSVAVSDDGSRAVLYSTAAGQGLVFVLATAPDSADYLVPRPVRVIAAVDGVFIAPDAEHALVALEPAAGSALAGAFAVISLTRELSAKIEPADAPITGVAFGPPPSTSALLTAKTGLTAYLVHLPSMLVDAVGLPSLPLAAGVVADEGIGYIAQEHPEGRLSFLDLESGDLKTLTGFELAAKVTDGSR